VFVDDELIAVGLNSARSIIAGGGGRLNQTQVAHAAARLRSAAPELVRIVVTHHPFDLPEGHRKTDLIGRSQMAMTQFAGVSADLFLAGHLHVSHVSRSVERYQIAGHSALVVQAGTMSTRGRGEPNSFNVLRVARDCISVSRQTWDEAHQAFLMAWSRDFQRTSDGWAHLAP
jgi:3',5'-cyclic AMP phosphodiesterase CpdA